MGSQKRQFSANIAVNRNFINRGQVGNKVPIKQITISLLSGKTETVKTLLFLLSTKYFCLKVAPEITSLSL